MYNHNNKGRNKSTILSSLGSNAEYLGATFGVKEYYWWWLTLQLRVDNVDMRTICDSSSLPVCVPTWTTMWVRFCGTNGAMLDKGTSLACFSGCGLCIHTRRWCCSLVQHIWYAWIVSVHIFPKFSWYIGIVKTIMHPNFLLCMSLSTLLVSMMEVSPRQIWARENEFGLWSFGNGISPW